MPKIALWPIITLLIGFTYSVCHPSSPEPLRVAYPGHLSGAFTGGFGEPTCRSCHFDYELNPDGGTLTVSGISDRITGGESVQITIQVERGELGRAGFQLSARYSDGRQAGQFSIDKNNRVLLTRDATDSLEYIQHSAAGSKPLEDHKTSWSVTWKAPQSVGDAVVFNIAANAANGDQSEFGDFIYAEELTAGLQ